MHVRSLAFGAMVLSCLSCQKKEAASVNIPSEALSNQVLNGRSISSAEHPSVGLVKSPDSICTGTLIGAAIVLTADHCVEDDRGFVTELEFTLESDLSQAQNWNRVRNVRRLSSQDIALLELEKPYLNIKPSELALDSLSYGDLYQTGEIVGYGNSRSSFVSGSKDSGAGVKRKGVSFLFNFDDGFDSLVSRPSQGQVICPGDSGGPLLMNRKGRAQLVGVANSVLWRGSCATVSQSFHRHVSYGQTKRWLLNQLAFLAKRIVVSQNNRPAFKILEVPSTFSNATCDVPLLRCQNTYRGTSFLATNSCGIHRFDSLLGYACRGWRTSQSPANSFEIFRLDHLISGKSVSVGYWGAVSLLNQDSAWRFVEFHGVHVLAP